MIASLYIIGIPSLQLAATRLGKDQGEARVMMRSSTAELQILQ